MEKVDARGQECKAADDLTYKYVEYILCTVQYIHLCHENSEHPVNLSFINF